VGEKMFPMELFRRKGAALSGSRITPPVLPEVLTRSTTFDFLVFCTILFGCSGF